MAIKVLDVYTKTAYNDKQESFQSINIKGVNELTQDVVYINIAIANDRKLSQELYVEGMDGSVFLHGNVEKELSNPKHLGENKYAYRLSGKTLFNLGLLKGGLSLKEKLAKITV